MSVKKILKDGFVQMGASFLIVCVPVTKYLSVEGSIETRQERFSMALAIAVTAAAFCVIL